MIMLDFSNILTKEIGNNGVLIDEIEKMHKKLSSSYQKNHIKN